MPIATVVFDMDGVLCDYRIDRRLAHLAALSGMAADAIHAAIWRSGFEHSADAGQVTLEDYLAGFGARMGRPMLTLAEWLEARRIAMEPDAAMLDLARRLQAKATIALLTNNGPALEATIDRAFPAIRPLFGERAFFSWRFGTAKPDPAVFAALCARLGTRPDETLFTDDHPENVEGARAAGLAAHHFTGIEGLRGELARWGLL